MLQHFPILRSFDSPERSVSKKRPSTTAASETAGSAESHLRLVKKSALPGCPTAGSLYISAQLGSKEQEDCFNTFRLKI